MHLNGKYQQKFRGNLFFRAYILLDTLIAKRDYNNRISFQESNNMKRKNVSVFTGHVCVTIVLHTRFVSLWICQRSVRTVETGQFITRLVSGFSQTNNHRWDIMKSGHLKRDRCTNIVRPPDGMETLLPGSTMGEKSKKHCQNQKTVSVSIFIFFFQSRKLRGYEKR